MNISYWKSFGGAIVVEGGARLTATGTTFVNNAVNTGEGGAIYTGTEPPGGTVNLTNCTFYHNGHDALACGVFASSPVTIVNCTFANHTFPNIVNSSFVGGCITLMNTIVTGGYPSNYYSSPAATGKRGFFRTIAP